MSENQVPDPNDYRPDPFETQPPGRIVFTTPVVEDKYPKGRAIAAAYWISYFALHWLTILEVVERSPTISGTTIYFFVFAVTASMIAVAYEETSKEKKEKNE